MCLDDMTREAQDMLQTMEEEKQRQLDEFNVREILQQEFPGVVLDGLVSNLVKLIQKARDG